MDQVLKFLDGFGYFPAVLITLALSFFLASLFVKAVRAVLIVVAVLGCAFYYVGADSAMQDKLNNYARDLVKPIVKLVEKR